MLKTHIAFYTWYISLVVRSSVFYHKKFTIGYKNSAAKEKGLLITASLASKLTAFSFWAFITDIR